MRVCLNIVDMVESLMNSNILLKEILILYVKVFP
jgi:hypothetical protein